AGRVLLVPDRRDCEVGTKLTAWIQDGKRMKPAPGLPKHKVRESRYGIAWIVRGIARLADGSEVLIWEGDGYEWDGKKFRRTFRLGIKDANHFDTALTAPAGDDGFFYLSNRRLFEIHRRKKPTRHAPKSSN